MSQPNLLEEFPPHSYEEWHDAAEALLKGAPFDKLLVSSTYEDITVQPIYRREDIEHIASCTHLPSKDSCVRGNRLVGSKCDGWLSSQEIHAPTPEEWNAIALEGLNGGQNELNIVLSMATSNGYDADIFPVRGQGDRGLLIENLEDMEKALKGIELEAISSIWRSGAGSLPVAALFFSFLEKRGICWQKVRCCFDIDPLAEMGLRGHLRQNLQTRLDHVAILMRFAIEHRLDMQTLCVQGNLYANSGASATQEVAYTLATLVSYIEKMRERGIAPSDTLKHLRIRLVMGSDFFMEIAKIRAMRGLVSKVAEIYEVSEPSIFIHVTTTRFNKTMYDAHTNMLRVTSESFGAVVAGADALTIESYDAIANTDTSFSRRIARNLHTILSEECNLNEVIDPAGGSYYVEWLTQQISEQAWGIFQGIEEEGGMILSLQEGIIQRDIDISYQRRIEHIRRRKAKIVGSNMYPDLKGKRLSPSPMLASAPPVFSEEKRQHFDQRGCLEPTRDMLGLIAAAKEGATVGQLADRCGLHEGKTFNIRQIPQRRAAAEYEALRDASELFAQKTGSPPALLQLNMGPSRRYRLRADWTSAFFEVAGFHVDGQRDFESIEQAVEALGQSKHKIAVITSDDASYATQVIPLARAIKEKHPDCYLLVAGAPGSQESPWKSAGVDDFVHVRVNNYKMNVHLLKQVGVIA